MARSRPWIRTATVSSIRMSWTHTRCTKRCAPFVCAPFVCAGVRTNKRCAYCRKVERRLAVEIQRVGARAGVLHCAKLLQHDGGSQGHSGGNVRSSPQVGASSSTIGKTSPNGEGCCLLLPTPEPCAWPRLLTRISVADHHAGVQPHDRGWNPRSGGDGRPGRRSPP